VRVTIGSDPDESPDAGTEFVRVEARFGVHAVGEVEGLRQVFVVKEVVVVREEVVGVCRLNGVDVALEGVLSVDDERGHCIREC